MVPAAREGLWGAARELRNFAARHPLAGHRRRPERGEDAERTARKMISEPALPCAALPSASWPGLAPPIHDLRTEGAPRGASRAQPARRCSILEEHGLPGKRRGWPGRGRARRDESRPL